MSKARNTGIEAANGDYILFVDSDDYLLPYAVEEVYKEIKESDADIVIWNYNYIKGESSSPNIDFPVGKHKCNYDDIEKLIGTALCPLIKSIEIPNKAFIGMAFSCNKLFRTDIIKDNSIRFREKVIIHEDVLFVCEYLKYVEKVIVTDKRLYNYRINEKGATLRFKPEIVESNRLFIEALGQTLNMESKVINDGYYSRIIRCLSNAAKYYCFHKDFKGNRFAALKGCINSCNEYRKAIKNVNMKYLTRKQKIPLAFLKLYAKLVNGIDQNWMKKGRDIYKEQDYKIGI